MKHGKSIPDEQAGAERQRPQLRSRFQQVHPSERASALPWKAHGFEPIPLAAFPRAPRDQLERQLRGMGMAGAGKAAASAAEQLSAPFPDREMPVGCAAASAGRPPPSPSHTAAGTAIRMPRSVTAAAHPHSSSQNRRRNKSEIRAANKAGSDAAAKRRLHPAGAADGQGRLGFCPSSALPGRAGDSRWRPRPWYGGTEPARLHKGALRAASATLCCCQPWLFTLAASQPLPNGAERLRRALPGRLPGGELPTERC